MSIELSAIMSGMGSRRSPVIFSDYNDVINPYSVEGYETLNMDFYDCLKESAEVTPPDCPLVLGCKVFTLQDNSHEAIIPYPLFLQVQEEMVRRASLETGTGKRRGLIRTVI